MRVQEFDIKRLGPRRAVLLVSCPVKGCHGMDAVDAGKRTCKCPKCGHEWEWAATRIGMKRAGVGR